MRLPKLAIENYQFTLIIILILVSLGAVSFMTMPRSEDPQVSPPGATIFAIYPGATPADLEQLVVDPIEEALNELDDVKLIDSNMKDGLALTTIEFVVGSNAEKKYDDVVQKVNTVLPQLPKEIWQLSTVKWSITDVNILQMALVSDSANYSTLEKEAERLKDMLEKIAGVKRVETLAYPQQEVRVELRTEKMAQNGLSLSQVTGAIQAANMNIPGGYVDLGSKRFNIQTSGDYQSLDDIRNTIVHSSGAKLVYLKDIANVTMSYEDQQYKARFNGHRAVFVNLKQKPHTNIFMIIENIEQKLAKFKQTLPVNISMHYVFNQADSVHHRISNFISNLLQGIVLVGVVMFLFLSFRASMIVMMAIPISILIGIGFVDMTGYGLQQMTIAGLVIVLGILVDNAIVVAENVSRFIKMGYSNIEAAVEGTKQIGWAIVSATATTLLAFVPIMMIGDMTGDFIRSMPVTVVYTLSASLLVALIFTPFLASRFLSANKIQHGNRVQNSMMKFVEGPYRKTLKYALGHRKLVIILALVAFMLSLLLFKVVGTSLFPKAEKPQFLINIQTPQGTNLDRTGEIATNVESLLLARDDVERVATNIGHSNPRIYYNIAEEREQSTHAQLFIQLKKYNRKRMAATIDALRATFKTWPGAVIEVKELEQGPPVEAPVAVKIIGPNLDELRQYALTVEKIVRSAEGTVNVKNPLQTNKTDLHVDINREKAGLFGVPLVEIDRTVRTCLTGMPVSIYRDANGDDYNIVLRLPIEGSPQLSDFDRIFVSSLTGTQIPLKQLATIEFIESPMEINHFKLERDVTITADVMSGYLVSDVTQQVVSKLDDIKLAPDYRFHIGGEQEHQQEAFGGMMKAIIIAAIGIIGVLVLQFRSFLQPMIVITAFPLAIIGATLALLITGYSFSFTAFVGLASLVGIVVNNSIILVDYTNQLLAQGRSIDDAVQEAGETRFRPIVLTTGTTIGGLLPLTLSGGTLWAPMGWVIIGGLTVSTILTLVIVPVLYKIFTPNGSR
ncbi:efflux RND transporter permease subunit [candidate division KSB1 bacterium]|nr:efflux RND transporter permease subunit [candidate division KSB1 bacterium]